jgi:hypothetical protein
LGYYAAVLKGTDIDQPRYFGESVTDAAQHPLRNRISAVKPFFFRCLMSHVDPKADLCGCGPNGPDAPIPAIAGA